MLVHFLSSLCPRIPSLPVPNPHLGGPGRQSVLSWGAKQLSLSTERNSPDLKFTEPPPQRQKHHGGNRLEGLSLPLVSQLRRDRREKLPVRCSSESVLSAVYRMRTFVIDLCSLHDSSYTLPSGSGTGIPGTSMFNAGHSLATKGQPL